MKKNILTTFTIVIFCIMSMKLFINATTECGSTPVACATLTNTDYITLRVGPFRHFSDINNPTLNFSENFCLNWQLDESNAILDWRKVFQNNYLVFIKIETTDNCPTWFIYAKICSNNEVFYNRRLNYDGSDLAGYPIPEYSLTTDVPNDIKISVPKERPFKISLTIYTKCDYCNEYASNKNSLVFETSKTFAKNAWLASGYIYIGNLDPRSSTYDPQWSGQDVYYQTGNPWNYCSGPYCQ